jgi:hypothetical protein
MSQVRPGNMTGACVLDTVGVGDFVGDRLWLTDELGVKDREDDSDSDVVRDVDNEQE